MDGLYSHSAYLLQELQEQRIQGLLCDCMLVVKGVCFKAHKNVLAAFSSYFRSLFQNSPALKSDVYHLAIQDVGGIGQILDYMYTSHLELNQDNAHTLLHIAQCLQVSNILSMCNSYLKQSAASTDPPLSLPALLSHEQDCVLGSPLPPEPELHCPTSDPHKHPLLLNPDADPIQYKRTQLAPPPGPADVSNNMALPERQPPHGYKLRNFYSKQYFKQSAAQNCSSGLSQTHCPLVVEEQCSVNQTLQNTAVANQNLQTISTNTANQNLQNTSVANQNLQNVPINAANQPLPAISSSAANQMLPPGPSDAGSTGLSHPAEPIVSQTPTFCATAAVPTSSSSSSSSCPEVLNPLPLAPLDPSAQGGEKSPPAPRALRPKKTVYLKKFNYLGSHRVLDEAAESSTATGSCSAETVQQGETQSQPAHLSSDAPLEDGVSESAEAPEPSLAPQPPSPPSPQPEHTQSKGQREGSGVTNSSNKYCCEVCGKTFKHPSNLELHKRSHTGEKPFQCNVCGKNFSQAGNLQTHLRRHSGEKPYICELCGKSFAASGDVQRHIIIHSGARPHLCDICGRGFSNFSNLKEHKKTHSSDKEFICEQCGKSFNMQRKLLKHTMRHTGEKPYCCQTCGKCFAGSGDLQRHVRSHTGERPYVCDTCGKGFTRTAVLRRHRAHCKPAVGSNSIPQPPGDGGDTLVQPHAGTNVLTQPHAGDATVLTQPHAGDATILTQPRAGDATVLTQPHAGDANVLTQPRAGDANVLTQPRAGDTTVLTQPHAGDATVLTQPRAGDATVLTQPHAGDATVLTQPHAGDTNVLTQPHAGDANVLTQTHAGDANVLTQPHAGDANVLTQPHAGDANVLTQPLTELHTADPGKATATPSHQSKTQPRPLPQPVSTLPPAGTCRPAPQPHSDPTPTTTPFTSHSSLSELRSIVPHHLLAPPPLSKPLPTPQKAPPPPIKPTLHPEPSFSSCGDENRTQSLSASALRPHLLAPEAQCSPPLASRSSGSQTHSAPYRSSEGFCSSGALWGLAMKTLQSDSDMDQ